MEPTTLGTFLKVIGGQFFSFLFPKIKNSKSFRDIRAKWTKDNYAQKTTLLFKAAVEDAKAAFNLPDQLVLNLLMDSINREEIFRWIIEGTSAEEFDANKLNLEPYMESNPQYQDLLRPFFELIIISIYEYKIIHWEPEFLELINKIENLEKATKDGFNNVIEKQTMAIQLAEENNRFLREVITPPEFKDLNDLIKMEKLDTAREKANERLRRPNLKRHEILELHAIIANTFIASRQYEEAKKHLYTAITHCDEEARKKRLEALVEIFENRLEQAFSNIDEAIRLEGYTDKNIDILVNILVEQKKFDEAIKMIEDHPEDEFIKLKAHIWLTSKEYEKVIDIANQQLEKEPLNIDWLMIKAESCVLKLENNIKNGNDNIIIFPEKTFEEVMPLLEKVEKQNIENEGILKRVKEIKAALYFRNKQFSEAKLLYEEIYHKSKDFSSFAFNNLLIACLCDEDWDKAIKIIKQKETVNHLEDKYIITLADVYIKTGKAIEAITLLKNNESQFTKSSKFPFGYYFSYIDALFSVLKHKEIKDLIGSIEKEENDLFAIAILKGYYSLKKHEWENAINYIEPNINQLEDTELIEGKTLLSQAYLNRGTIEDYKKLKELIKTIPNWIHHEFLVNRYTQSLYHLGEYEDIVSLYNNLPYESIFIFDITTTIYFNLGWYDIAKENYLSLYQKTGDLEYQLRYASCLYRLGKTKDCYEILSSAENRVEKSGKVADYQLLCLSYLDALEYRKAMEFAYKTFLAGKDEPEVWKFFFIQMSQLSQFVNNPDEKWIKEYHKIYEEFEKEFPEEEPIFKKVQVLENGKISNELIDELKRPKDASLHLKSSLVEHKLPMSFIVSVMNKGPFETWNHVVNEKDVLLWTVNGSVQELLPGGMIAGVSANILCDITTLLTLQNLELLEMLKEKFQLYIYQDQFDAAFQEYTRNKLINDEGLMFLTYENGKVRMTEYASEQVKESLKKQENIIKWINENCIKVGNLISNRYGNEFKENKAAFLYHPIEICKNKSFTMLVDSVIVNDLAKNHYEVNCFSTIDFINLLLAEDKIDKGMHSELIGKLLLMGYVLIPVNKDVFVHYLKKTNYKVNFEVSLLFDYLKIKFFNEEFLTDLIAEILAWVWTEEIPLYDRQKITDQLCIALSINRNKSKVISKLIDHSKSKFSFLIEHQRIKMEKCIVTWLKGQSII